MPNLLQGSDVIGGQIAGLGAAMNGLGDISGVRALQQMRLSQPKATPWDASLSGIPQTQNFTPQKPTWQSTFTQGKQTFTPVKDVAGDLRSGFGQQDNGMSQPGGLPTVGGISNTGGDWAALDRFNGDLSQAAAKFGVPANLLKSIINNESSGDWERDGSRVVYLPDRGTRILPFAGILESTATALGYNFNQLIGNRGLQLEVAAKVLSNQYAQYGNWDSAVKAYFGGSTAVNGSFVDENGLESNQYANKALNNWHYLDSQTQGGSSQVAPINGMWGGNPAGNNIVNIATSFVGKVPYVWGGIPGKGETPTGWDCSGFTYWLNQNYGDGQLPMGSHYQYQYAQQTGKLFTNLSQLQPGDLVFINTGWQGGAGSELNQAGHVAMYIGNGQIVHAANPDQGTIISNLSAYGNVLGAMHAPWSGGSGGTFSPGQTGGGYGGQSMAASIHNFMLGHR